MRKVTLILTLILAFVINKAQAQATYLQVYNQTNETMDVTFQYSNTDCTDPVALCFTVPPNTLGQYPPLALGTIVKVRISPGICSTDDCSSTVAGVSLGSPCTPCPTGGFPGSGNFNDGPCGGANAYNANWVRCLNPGGSYLNQGNLIIVRYL